MKPLAIHHVAVNVDDVAQAVAFYTHALGGTIRTDRPRVDTEGAWINLGESQLHLIKAPVPPELGQHFALTVNNLDVVVKELRSGGYVVSDPTEIGESRQCFLKDPSGNAIELRGA